MRDIELEGTDYLYYGSFQQPLEKISKRVADLRRDGALKPEYLHRLRKFFKMKNIYHSNAIEGNVLDIGETRQVVELGLTLTGKPLKDQSEAKNLSEAIDYLESLVKDNSEPIMERNIREIHKLVLKGIDNENAGSYRKVEVTIGGSEHKPPGHESVPAQMEAFTEWLKNISCPSESASPMDGITSAVAAHAWFVTIHPFIDGNGRTARLLMNLILMRYGVPIAIVTRDDRERYYEALAEADGVNLSLFLSLIIECLEESLDEYQEAVREQRAHQEWAESIASRFDQPGLVTARNKYEVWKNAFGLLKSYARQTAENLAKTTKTARITFRDFGDLGFEKFVSLEQRESAKKTWFFGLRFIQGHGEEKKKSTYLFFFGWAKNPKLADRCWVTLTISREEPFQSIPLRDITAPNVPSIHEIGYDFKTENFVDQEGVPYKMENLVRNFIGQVIKRQFSS